MRTGKLSVEKARKTTDSKATYSLSPSFKDFEFKDFEIVADKQTNSTEELIGEFKPVNVRDLLDSINEAMDNLLSKSLFDLDSPFDSPFFRPAYRITIPLNWGRAVRTNHNPITPQQMFELETRFRCVNSKSLRENFSEEFAEFLLNAIKYYNVDVSKFGLESDAYLANMVEYDNMYVNFQGDVQEGECWSYGDTQFAVLHELRHIMQYNRGWLSLSCMHKLLYKGMECLRSEDSRYNLSPAEYDANRFAMESPLWTDKNLSIFKHLPPEINSAPEYQHNRWCEAYG